MRSLIWTTHHRCSEVQQWRSCRVAFPDTASELSGIAPVCERPRLRPGDSRTDDQDETLQAGLCQEDAPRGHKTLEPQEKPMSEAATELPWPEERARVHNPRGRKTTLETGGSTSFNVLTVRLIIAVSGRTAHTFHFVIQGSRKTAMLLKTNLK